MIAIAALLLVGALIAGRRRLWIGPLGPLAVLGVLLVRLWGIPALERHQYDGHEADHLSFFLGTAAPGAADTLRYPLMQWWWWLWGVLLPADPRLPIVISAVAASLGAAALAGGIGVLAGKRAGWVALLVLALHPTHVAWSSSAYNVGLPVALGGLAVLGVAIGRAQPTERWPLVLTAAALALATNGRLELAVLALPCGLLALGDAGNAAQILKRWGPVLIGGLLLAAPGLWAVVAAGPLPGAEERAQSFAINQGLLDYHTPYHHSVGLILLAVGLLAAGRRWSWTTLALSSVIVVNHLLVATFNDYGARHTLPALVGIAWLLGAGAAALPRSLTPGVILGILWLSLPALFDLRERFYAEEDAFVAILSAPPYDDLPRWDGPPDDDCGWIAEDARVASDPPRSHFNLLSPQEAAALRGDGGCLRWCLDIQDWRWSSRSVRDRGIRLRYLYALRSEAVVLERSSGYACLVMRVGERSTGASLLTEWHGRGHPADSRLP